MFGGFLMNNRIRIGDLSKRAGVTPRTVRYYESIGLIPPGEREGQGQHYYAEETVARLRKIIQLKKLRLSLDEIRDVIDLYFTDPSGIQAKQKVLAILRRHLDEVEAKISGFQQFRTELQEHIGRFEKRLGDREHN
jgi:MerR family transcriptional regulator, copper efflux regulator